MMGLSHWNGIVNRGTPTHYFIGPKTFLGYTLKTSNDTDCLRIAVKLTFLTWHGQGSYGVL